MWFERGMYEALRDLVSRRDRRTAMEEFLPHLRALVQRTGKAYMWHLKNGHPLAGTVLYALDSAGVERLNESVTEALLHGILEMWAVMYPEEDSPDFVVEAELDYTADRPCLRIQVDPGDISGEWR